MRIQTFTYTPDQLAEEATMQCHNTLWYLHRNGYLTAEQLSDLTSRLLVAPVPNRPKFGKILKRLFGQDTPEDAYTFPIVSLEPEKNPFLSPDHALNEEEAPAAVPVKTGPNLTLVTNNDKPTS